MITDALIAAVSGIVSGAAWVRLHRHPDLVPRTEFELVLHRLGEIRADLQYLRERLDTETWGG